MGHGRLIVNQKKHQKTQDHDGLDFQGVGRILFQEYSYVKNSVEENHKDLLN